MSTSRTIEWDFFFFVSHISGYSVQVIIVDKKKGMVKLEDGYVDSNKIQLPLTKEFLAEMESCFEAIHLYDWAKGNYNPCADGEQWSFEFYMGSERVLLRIGSNAYPHGYEKWIEFYSRLLKEKGIAEVHTCYQKEREGCIFREEYD